MHLVSQNSQHVCAKDKKKKIVHLVPCAPKEVCIKYISTREWTRVQCNLYSPSTMGNVAMLLTMYKKYIVEQEILNRSEGFRLFTDTKFLINYK